MDLGIGGASSGNGICGKHGSMISRNGVPWCPRCESEANVAAIRPESIVTVEDPGEGFFRGQGAVQQPAPAAAVKPLQAGASFAACISTALSALQQCPMPKDLKMFKLLQKTIVLLEQAANEEK